jgi:uncharacterized protein
MRKICRGAVFIFILFSCLILPLAARPRQLPRPTGFVNDFAGVMKTPDKEAVESLAAALKEKTGAELAVVTVKSFASYGFGSIDEFSIALAEAWGVGERGEDNGVILVLAVEERKVRIEVGYGLEGTIPDSVAGKILDNSVIPAFRNNDFSGGLVEGVRAIAACAAKESGANFDEFDLPKTPEAAVTGDRSILYKIIVVLILFLFNSHYIFYIVIIVSIVLFILQRIFKFKKPLIRFGGFGSGGGSGSFGRSFGSSGGRSFGGGSFGGGGASRGF